MRYLPLITCLLGLSLSVNAGVWYDGQDPDMFISSGGIDAGAVADIVSNVLSGAVGESVQGGVITVSGGTTAVEFATAYTTTPYVVATPSYAFSNLISVQILDVTTTNFSFVVEDSSPAYVTTACDVYWVASPDRTLLLAFPPDVVYTNVAISNLTVYGTLTGELDPEFTSWTNQSDIAAGAGASAVNSAVAIGEGASASSLYGVSLGYLSRVYNNSGIAIGQSAIATNVRSVALGPNAYAQGAGIAIGYSAFATNSSIGIGTGSTPAGTTLAEGLSSVAIGGGQTAVGATNSIAIGARALASNSTTIAIGAGVTNSTSDTVAIPSGVPVAANHAVSLGHLTNYIAQISKFTASATSVTFSAAFTNDFSVICSATAPSVYIGRGYLVATNTVSPALDEDVVLTFYSAGTRKGAEAWWRADMRTIQYGLNADPAAGADTFVLDSVDGLEESDLILIFEGATREYGRIRSIDTGTSTIILEDAVANDYSASADVSRAVEFGGFYLPTGTLYGRVTSTNAFTAPFMINVETRQ